MKKATCTAVVEHNRIQLVIRKEDPGYKAFANVLNQMEERGSMSWYGDITNADGKEQSGLVITCGGTRRRDGSGGGKGNRGTKRQPKK
jgi:hypothetical protein